ncbi:unnamed protein product [Ectocarpus sp. 13 AM-2016]
MPMFVKPIMIFQGSTQSGRVVCRRLVARNVLCTVAVVLGYTITTAVVVLARSPLPPETTGRFPCLSGSPAA